METQLKLVSTFKFKNNDIEWMKELGVEPVIFDSEEELANASVSHNAQIIIANHRTLNQEFLKKCREVRWIQLSHVGIERLPMDYLENRQVIVVNSRGCSGVPIAEDILAKMLMFSRKSAEVYRNQLKREWIKIKGIANLSEKTLGIIGTGDIGTETALRARPFGMNIIGINSDGRFMPDFNKTFSLDQLNEVIAQSDFIILTLPLTEKTVNLIDKEQFECMKPNAVLINVSRGALINEEHLIDVLRNDKIGGAALDVFVEEFKYRKLPPKSPFWDLDNVIITPHYAGMGDGFYACFMNLFRDNLEKYKAGLVDQMVNVCQYGKGY